MGVLNPNSTGYVHPNEPNLLNIHKAMTYDPANGEPHLRVTLGSDTITITGDVNLLDTVSLTSSTLAALETVTINNTSFAITNFPTTSTVYQGTIPWITTVTNWPALQYVNGTLYAVQSGTWSVGVTGNVTVDNFTSTVNVASMPAVSGTVAVSSLPSITGSVTVTNFTSTVNIASMPAVSGTVAISSLPAVTGTVTVNGSVTVTNFTSTVNVASLPAITGTVVVSNFTSTVRVDNFPTSVTVTNFTSTVFVSNTLTISNTSFAVTNFPTTSTVYQGTDPWQVEATITGTNTVEFSHDSAMVSPFGRLKISQSRLMGEWRIMYGTTGPVEVVSFTVGSGSHSTSYVNNVSSLTVTGVLNDRVVRQSRQYFPYIDGSGTISFITTRFNAAAASVKQMCGTFDDSNGIFLQINELTPQIVVRSGGVDTEVIDQTNWNINTFKAGDSAVKNPAGYVIDFTKAFQLVIETQWSGTGRARVGISVNGEIVNCHEFSHWNTQTVPYMEQPSLPVRWEIKNISTGVAATMAMIAFAVYNEGFDYESGFTNSVSSGAGDGLTITSGQRGVLAVRLRNTVQSKPMRAFARLKNWNIITNNNCRYRVMMLQSVADITTSTTWTSVPGSGWCEYTTNFAITNTPANAVVLVDSYAVGNNGNSAGATSLTGVENRSAAIYQNYDSTSSMIFAVVAEKIANTNPTVYASLSWTEVK